MPVFSEKGPGDRTFSKCVFQGGTYFFFRLSLFVLSALTKELKYIN